ncbi:hypothetical protein ABZ348_24110 [Streptomyces sp. NPDC005963]|uniref:hypothetical protein n=1 Tax=Streptomyces sp. NPDC005963 TaxID=3156721 RepID=UPI0033E82B9D
MDDDDDSSSGARAGGLERFVELSVALTGFNAVELTRTGMAATYRAWVGRQVDPELYAELISASTDGVCALDEGPVRELARSICHLWYLGVWPASGVHGPPTAPTVVAGRAYAHGLVWRTFGTHAPGAGAPGHGSWAAPPVEIARGDER